MRRFLSLVSLGSLLACAPDATVADPPAEPVPTETAQCPASLTPDAETVRSVSGENGTFVDHCNDEGNLVEHTCSYKQEYTCGDPSDPLTCHESLVHTAHVLAQVVDCAGTCVAGRCQRRCPRKGDQLRFDGPDGAGRFLVSNTTRGDDYTCETGDGACPTPFAEGDTWLHPWDPSADELTCLGSETFIVGRESCSLFCAVQLD